MDFLQWNGENVHWTSALSVFVLILNCVGMFSNSFTVFEDSVVRYLAQTLLVLLLLGRVSFHESLRSRKKATNSLLKVLTLYLGGRKPIFYCIAAAIIIRCGAVFNRCREEQGPGCSPSVFALTFASLSDSSPLKTARFSLAFLSLVGLFLLFRWFLKRNGHFVGYGITGLTFSVSSTLSLLATLAYWLGLWLPEPVAQRYATFLQLVLPGIVYCCFALFVPSFIFDPILAHFTSDTEKFRLKKEIVTKRLIFEEVKRNWTQVYGSKNPNEGQSLKVYGYGLSTGYTGNYTAFLWMVFAILSLLLGEGMVASWGQMVVVMVISVELSAGSPTLLLPLWCLLAQHWFYALGHHATFSSIPWDAAFVGLPGNFKYQSVVASFVLTNLTASHILCALALPLLAVWNQYRGKLGVLALRSAASNGLGGGITEFDLVKRDGGSTVVGNVGRLGLQYVTFLALKMLAVCAASALHRRHLMVWKIFAPKFIFEGVSFLVSCVCLLLGFVVFARIDHCLINRKIKL